MNMWIVLCQAFTFAIFISQYHFFQEVEAEEPQTLSAGGWFGDLEKKLNGVMHDVFQTIKRSAQKIPLRATPHRRTIILAQESPTTPGLMLEDVTNTTNNEDANTEEMCSSTKSDGVLVLKALSIPEMENGEEYASGLSNEYSEFNDNYQTHSPRVHQKKKKKSKKPKKKIKPKRKNKKPHTEIPHVERKHPVRTRAPKPHVSRPHIERERAEQKDLKKMKPQKNKLTKFVKTTVDNNKLNDSDSDEGKRGKPVDIIVHIKMNE